MRRVTAVVSTISLVGNLASLLTYILIAKIIGINRITDSMAWAGSFPLFAGSAVAASLQYSLPPLLVQWSVERGEEACAKPHRILGTILFATGLLSLTGVAVSLGILEAFKSHLGLDNSLAQRFS